MTRHRPSPRPEFVNAHPRRWIVETESPAGQTLMSTAVRTVRVDYDDILGFSPNGAKCSGSFNGTLAGQRLPEN